MGAWYWIGVLAGLGVALGILAAGVVPRWIVAAVAAAIAGGVIGIVAFKWDEAVGGAVGGLAGGFGAAPIVAGALRRGGTRGGLATLVGLVAVWEPGRSPSCRCSATSRRSRCRCSRCACAGRRPSGTPGCARSHVTEGRQPRPVVLIVIDGLTPSMLEATDAPALRFLLDHGSYRRAASTFPSLTPVCLASIATGGHPDVHGIPHLVWWHRGEERLVEYGSSFAALRASGLVQGLRDTVVNLNERHLFRSVDTIYEALENTGLTTAAINITTYRGRHRHLSSIPGFPPVYGPKRFFFYSVYESDGPGRSDRVAQPGARLDRRLRGRDRALARHRDGFDLLVYYLPDYDYASHALGPDAAHEALGRADASIEAIFAAAGGRDAFLERYAVVLCSDHGQSPVERSARLAVPGALVTASNRAAMLYGDDPRRLAMALDDEPSVDVALFLDHGEVRARRGVTRISRSSTSIRTAAPALKALCATRMRGRCSFRPRRAGNSPIWRVGITSAAGATARSRRATPRCRC